MNPQTEPRVRRAFASDADALARLRFDFRRSQALAGRRPEPVEAETDFIARFSAWVRAHLVDDGPWRAWVLETDDGFVGNVWLQVIDKLPNPGSESERHGYLSNFFVRDTHRGRGAGSRLLAALLHECVVLDLDSIFLWPTDQSRPLYSRHGFHPATTIMVLDRGH